MQTMETEKYWDALTEVMDPEFPISVVDMGLIYGITKVDEGKLAVRMTYTSTGCGCMQWIENDIKERLLQEDIAEVEIEVVWSPPWTVNNLTEKGRAKLKTWGVSS
ncbi:metal-sulfur cluster assembly factor [Neobacillus cucumis]|uniref:metal-sulfur cluster assembly factor n=1 Tax=Neobacillus cucumis TaxID=1740721 RepID=UPI0018DFD2CF|nr:metal-sulfur cluster assembly factor [Neobacillus cucumis]MBI0577522.1 metal-sulfur cluster assembly factor [Neobacillus cucumis]